MIEKFREKNSFVDRLQLSDETKLAIQVYHSEKNGYNYTEGGEKVLSTKGLIGTYGELLRIARTIYVPGDILSELGLEYDYIEHSVSEFDTYVVKYRPKPIKKDVWEELVKAFAYGGYLRSFTDERCLLWVEIDYILSSLIDQFTDGETNFTGGLPLVIGCLNPRTNFEYEEFDGEFTYSGLLKFFKYLKLKIGLEIDISSDSSEEGKNYVKFVDSFLGNMEICLLLSRADILNDINRIYHGMPVNILI